MDQKLETIFFFFWTLFILSFVMHSIIAIPRTIKNVHYSVNFLRFRKGYWTKKIFDHNFVKWYHCKLCYELIQLFQEKKECVECFQGEFEFHGRDWHTGKTWSVTLSDSIHYTEKLQLDKLKHKKLPLLLGYPKDTIKVWFNDTI